MVRNQTRDYYLSQPTSSLLPSSTPYLLNSTALWHPSGQNTSSTPPLSGSPSGQNTSSTPLLSGTPSGQNISSAPQLHHSLVPPVDKIPPPLLNSAALGRPKWTKYLLPSLIPPLFGTPRGQITSSPPQFHCSLVPPVDKIPPPLLNSTALWYPQWTKYFLNSSTPPLSGTPSGQNTSSPPQLHHSLVPPVDKIPPILLNSVALGRPKWPPPCFQAAQVTPPCSLAPQMALSNPLSGALWRLS